MLPSIALAYRLISKVGMVTPALEMTCWAFTAFENTLAANKIISKKVFMFVRFGLFTLKKCFG